MSSDMISAEQLLAPATPDAQNPWPHSPPVEGQVYGFTCPSTGADMVAMTKETFLNFGTQMEAMRRAAERLDGRCKELVGQYNTLADKHNALREAVRNERRARVERQIAKHRR